MLKKILKIFLIIIAVVCVIICAASLTFILQYKKGLSDHEALVQQVKSNFTALRNNDNNDDNNNQPNMPELPVETPEPVVELPVDFAALEEINTDIYAWLEIPATTVNYPVVQSRDDDNYYNNHGSNGKYSLYGSIFSQASYNGRDFRDPVTVLYGHNVVYGMENMFALLNNYADAEYFDSHGTIYIYTPDRVLEYRVFAAYLHSNEHLLAYRDFSNPEEYTEFFDSIRNCALYGNFNDDYMPSPGDRVLTLSTCFAKNNRQRYLVQAVLVDEMKAEFTRPVDAEEAD